MEVRRWEVRSEEVGSGSVSKEVGSGSEKWK